MLGCSESSVLALDCVGLRVRMTDALLVYGSGTSSRGQSCCDDWYAAPTKIVIRKSFTKLINSFHRLNLKSCFVNGKKSFVDFKGPCGLIPPDNL